MTYAQKVGLLQFAGGVSREEAVDFMRMWIAMEAMVRPEEKEPEPPAMIELNPLT